MIDSVCKRVVNLQNLRL